MRRERGISHRYLLYRVCALNARVHSMHANTQTPLISQRDNSTTIASINKALKYLKSLSPREDFEYTKVAAKFGVDRSTLSRRHRGLTQPRATSYNDRRNLTTTEEAELVRYMEGLSERHMPPTRDMIQNFASSIAKKQVSKSWVTRFINRNSVHLISK